MFDDISRNQGLYKMLFLIIGLVLISFCFFFDAAEFDLQSDKFQTFLTFSAKQHTIGDYGDCYTKIPDLFDDSLVNTVKATPFLGGFALGFGGLIILFSLGQTLISRVIKKYHIWIIQLICLFLEWVLILLIPILYFTTKTDKWKLCWFPIIFEFLALISTTFAAVLYFKSNQSKGTQLLS
ncbi:unnamed protein product [Paramecium sonneborni]|uniref:Uncharacterized protein n=1 Tax=Paramecium sonneborni TaxID=65129 RepID=A0A8S1KSK8_9CILI|nr:unnamed protein product [Paramecium sonneborni]